MKSSFSPPRNCGKNVLSLVSFGETDGEKHMKEFQKDREGWVVHMKVTWHEFRSAEVLLS